MNAMPPASHTMLTTLRLCLRANGYQPVPISSPDMGVKAAGKRPLMSDWRTVCAGADDAVVQSWQNSEPGSTNTGLLCGTLIGVDGDIPVPELADQVARLAEALLGWTPLLRIGQAPKWLRCYRVEAPLTKIETPELFLPDGTKMQVEALGQGQQFVAHGIHPDTRQPYAWPESGPQSVTFDELPAITETALRAFVAASEAVLRAAGGKEKTKPGSDNVPPRQSEAKPAAASGGEFFTSVNAAALRSIGAWLPVIFPSAKEQPGTGAWRVSSDKLGRDLEEDLSVHPGGGQDFGTGQGRSPVDIVLEHGGAPDAKAAAFWICEKLGRAPADFGWKQAKPNERPGSPWEDKPKKERPPAALLMPVDPTTLFGVAVPRREWIVEDWLPVGYTTILYADGGTGKTLLAQQLATACATGRPWCGLAVARCRVFALFCEDDQGEMHRRQHDINAAMDVHFGELGDMRWVCPVGQDNALVRFEAAGEPVLTDRYFDLIRQAKEFGARLVVIDTAADTFGGNENDRQQVRQFIGHALSRIAQEINGAVLLNAHPSRSGMSSSGDLDGGSTGWSNSARSRWSLTRPEAEEGAAVDEDVRLLTRRKANHARIGDQVKLRWTRGALMPEARPGASPFTAANRLLEVEELFLALLAACRTSNVNLSMSKNATNYAPTWFAKRPDRQGSTKKEFEAAMASLFAQKRLCMENYGRKGDSRTRIAVVDCDAPDDEMEVSETG